MKKLIATLLLTCSLVSPAWSIEPTEPSPCVEEIEKIISNDARVILQKKDIKSFAETLEDVLGKSPHKELVEAEVLIFLPTNDKPYTIIATLRKDCTWVNGGIMNEDLVEVMNVWRPEL